MKRELDGETEMVADDPEAIGPALPGALIPVAAV